MPCPACIIQSKIRGEAVRCPKCYETKEEKAPKEEPYWEFGGESGARRPSIDGGFRDDRVDDKRDS